MTSAASGPKDESDSVMFEALRASELHYRQLFEQNVAGVYRVALDGRILDLNVAMAQMLGVSRSEMLGHNARISYFDPADREAWVSELLEKGALVNYLHRLRRRDGSPIWIMENCSLIDDPSSGGRVVLGTAIDITDRKALEDRLETLAYRDPLTGLANRRMLQHMAEKALARAGRERGHVALLYVDIVRFKRINDVLGHSAGDQVLREIAVRFSGFVRAADTLARVGGDEFALLLVSPGTMEAATQPARKMREAMSRPFVIDGQPYHVDARIGVAFYPDHAATFDELLSRADLANHQASSDDGGVAVFKPLDVRHGRAELLLEERFRDALEEDEFILHYQPIFRLPDCTPAGVEGLLRWKQPDGRLLGADQFVSIAEQTGLIRRLDRWALRHALRQIRLWTDGCNPGWVALNLTPSAFDDPAFPSLVADALDEFGIDPAILALEITERVTMRDPRTAIQVLNDLKMLGLRVVIDDFGQGHSSLAYLKDFPVDALKIDRLFVGRLGSNSKDERLVEGIIALSRGLGIDLIAEGVETEDQLEWLRRNGCAFAQGFHLHYPVAPENITALFNDRARSTT
jgi:diguanylate cyclase (GGDEF)-like protein/PAS domain S-box-containing protein